MSEKFHQLSLDYQRIEQAIIFLEKNFHHQPTLKEIADSVYVSEYHFQRLFSSWVGISPKRFLQYLTKEYAKRLLKESRNVLDVSFETGLSSPGRLHDLFVNCEAVTPGEFKDQGEGLRIEYGIHPTPFGDILLATTARGICWLSFVKKEGPEQEIQNLQKSWPKGELCENASETKKLANRVFAISYNGSSKPQSFNLFLKGTNFQIKVWEALLKIPAGQVVSYEDVAAYIGKPKAVRAVANAVGSNPIPFIIPCHRVIRKIGEFGGYAGGTARKKALLGWEAARYQSV
ncbi:methylated-DNA--[protein]-cysteine S-methyltransferase [candidate division KSB1 bacterium]|nr:methylated-DNA--[protein]-cysteine S-methyltransferase [candidate division KSB1 bacterium]MCH8955174.1 methylated-DNA--[protein]-cysteine S-methyltransferase [candidate division KSB1 bacterium]